MYRYFLPEIGTNARRGEVWIRARRSHKHTYMREFTRFHRLAKISAIDIGARVVHLRSSINTRDFCIQIRVSYSLLVLTHSLSLSFSLYYSVACGTCILSLIHGDPVATTTCIDYVVYIISDGNSAWITRLLFCLHCAWIWLKINALSRKFCIASEAADDLSLQICLK